MSFLSHKPAKQFIGAVTSLCLLHGSISGSWAQERRASPEFAGLNAALPAAITLQENIVDTPALPGACRAGPSREIRTAIAAVSRFAELDGMGAGSQSMPTVI